jgi:hypothetical protein
MPYLYLSVVGGGELGVIIFGYAYVMLILGLFLSSNGPDIKVSYVNGLPKKKLGDDFADDCNGEFAVNEIYGEGKPKFDVYLAI